MKKRYMASIMAILVNCIGFTMTADIPDAVITRQKNQAIEFFGRGFLGYQGLLSVQEAYKKKESSNVYEQRMWKRPLTKAAAFIGAAGYGRMGKLWDTATGLLWLWKTVGDVVDSGLLNKKKEDLKFDTAYLPLCGKVFAASYFGLWSAAHLVNALSHL